MSSNHIQVQIVTSNIQGDQKSSPRFQLKTGWNLWINDHKLIKHNSSKNYLSNFFFKVHTGGATQAFHEKVYFWHIFQYFVIFHHSISIVSSKSFFHHEVPSLFVFHKWAYFWSHHVNISIYHKKHEDSFSKRLCFSYKIALFFPSLFFWNICVAPYGGT